MFSDGLIEIPCLSLLTPFLSPLATAPRPTHMAPSDVSGEDPEGCLPASSLQGLWSKETSSEPPDSSRFLSPWTADSHLTSWSLSSPSEMGIHPHLHIFKEGNLGENTEVSLLHLKNCELALEPEHCLLCILLMMRRASVCVHCAGH